MYDIKDDLAIFEGDIVLGTVDEAERWREINEDSHTNHQGENAVIITGMRYRWKGGILPYHIAPNVSSSTRKLIARAIAHWQSKTPVRFVKRTSRNAKKYPNYVEVISNQYACWSYVEKKGKKQELNVVSACGVGGIIHEFGHALGLWHEQSRADRNRYIRINWQNIKTQSRHNFNQHIKDGNDIGTYDYASIMHYGRKAFSKNAKDTITVRKSNVSIGQRRGLSTKDIQSIKKMYPSQGFKLAHIITPSPNQKLRSSTMTITWAKNDASKVFLYVYDYGRRKTCYSGYMYGNTTSKTIRNLSSTGNKIRVYVSSYVGKTRKGADNIYVKAKKRY